MKTINQNQVRRLRIPTEADAVAAPINTGEITVIESTGILYVCRAIQSYPSDIALDNGNFLSNVSLGGGGGRSTKYKIQLRIDAAGNILEAYESHNFGVSVSKVATGEYQISESLGAGTLANAVITAVINGNTPGIVTATSNTFTTVYTWDLAGTAADRGFYVNIEWEV